MAEQITPISRAVSDILTGAYNKKRLTQEVVAQRAEMSIWTLQKKLKGRSPISATDLVVLSEAIGVDPAGVLQEAMDDVENARLLTSEGVASISEQRRKKTPATMTDEELEGERNAANTDPEMGGDEPDPT
jgi:transcriptional regulator with XRE-family HTH domain